VKFWNCNQYYGYFRYIRQTENFFFAWVNLFKTLALKIFVSSLKFWKKNCLYKKLLEQDCWD